MLGIVSLEYNNLQGQIPKEIGTLTRLCTLKLFDHRIEGTIPSKIGKVQQLKMQIVVNSHAFIGTNPFHHCTLNSLCSHLNLKIIKLYQTTLCIPITGPCFFSEIIHNSFFYSIPYLLAFSYHPPIQQYLLINKKCFNLIL